MSGKTGEYRYSITTQLEMGEHASHEDSDKHYGAGTSDMKGGKHIGSCMVTFRCDDPQHDIKQLQEALPAIDEVAAMLQQTCHKGTIVGILLAKGAEIEIEKKDGQAASPPRPPTTPKPTPKSAPKKNTTEPEYIPPSREQLTYLHDLIAGRIRGTPITPASVREELVERRAAIVGEHLRWATKARDREVQDLDSLTSHEASQLIDALKKEKPNRKG